MSDRGWWLIHLPSCVDTALWINSWHSIHPHHLVYVDNEHYGCRGSSMTMRFRERFLWLAILHAICEKLIGVGFQILELFRLKHSCSYYAHCEGQKFISQYWGPSKGKIGCRQMDPYNWTTTKYNTFLFLEGDKLKWSLSMDALLSE